MLVLHGASWLDGDLMIELTSFISRLTLNESKLLCKLYFAFTYQ